MPRTDFGDTIFIRAPAVYVFDNRTQINRNLPKKNNRIMKKKEEESLKKMLHEKVFQTPDRQPV